MIETFEEFIERKQKELDAFRDYWKKESEKYPNCYPMELSTDNEPYETMLAGYDAQFVSYCE